MSDNTQPLLRNNQPRAALTQFVFNVFVITAFFGAIYLFLMMQVSSPTFAIIKSLADSKEYGYSASVGTNGPRHIVVYDPEAKMTAFAFGVSVGSFADPVEIPGLAHFTEHMLFLGNEKYPESNGYDEYVTSHGGKSNAFTDSEQTVFYSNVNVDGFPQALDMMLNFFVNPNFDSTLVDAEIHAVDSEDTIHHSDTTWRILSAVGSLERAPFNKFSTGNSETLAAVPDLPEQLKQYFDSNFCLNRISVATYGPHPVNEQLAFFQFLVEQIQGSTPVGCEKNAMNFLQTDRTHDHVTDHVTGSILNLRNGDSNSIKKFRETESSFLEISTNLTLPLKSENFGSLIKVAAPQSADPQMWFGFPFPGLKYSYRSKPLEYLDIVISYPGEGGLKDLLRSSNLATDISLLTDDSLEGCMGYIVVYLTSTGIANQQLVQSTVFGFIEQLKLEGVSSALYSQITRIKQSMFDTDPGGSPTDLVKSLASGLTLNFQPEELLIYDQIILAMNVTAVDEVLGFLDSQKSVIVVYDPTYILEIPDDVKSTTFPEMKEGGLVNVSDGNAVGGRFDIEGETAQGIWNHWYEFGYSLNKLNISEIIVESENQLNLLSFSEIGINAVLQGSIDLLKESGNFFALVSTSTSMTESASSISTSSNTSSSGPFQIVQELSVVSPEITSIKKGTADWISAGITPERVGVESSNSSNPLVSHHSRWLRPSYLYPDLPRGYLFVSLAFKEAFLEIAAEANSHLLKSCVASSMRKEAADFVIAGFDFEMNWTRVGLEWIIKGWTSKDEESSSSDSDSNTSSRSSLSAKSKVAETTSPAEDVLSLLKLLVNATFEASCSKEYDTLFESVKQSYASPGQSRLLDLISEQIDAMTMFAPTSEDVFTLFQSEADSLASTTDDLKSWFTDMSQDAHVTVYGAGLVTQKDMLVASKIVQSAIDATRKVSATSSSTSNEPVYFYGGQAYTSSIAVRQLSPFAGVSSNVAIMNAYVYGPSSEMKERVCLSLISSMLDADAFAFLRTKHQLGYVAFAFSGVFPGSTGSLQLRVGIQGTDISPDLMDLRIEQLMIEFGDGLVDMSEDEISVWVQSEKDALNELPDSELSELKRFWPPLRDHTNCFTRREQQLDYLENTPIYEIKTDLLQTWDIITNPNRIKLSAKIFASQTDLVRPTDLTTILNEPESTTDSTDFESLALQQAFTRWQTDERNAYVIPDANRYHVDQAILAVGTEAKVYTPTLPQCALIIHSTTTMTHTTSLSTLPNAEGRSHVHGFKQEPPHAKTPKVSQSVRHVVREEFDSAESIFDIFGKAAN